ncbi:Sua5/YciO/YrdC/YwlC family protein [Thiothrix unzii]|uniref:Sua5/YciO/YrdC/YwlC family protein n=1 Tax=Thiothrix unzii TaxID=111769 RepID=A0A975IHJ1_9GAMM|nr:Sua5/YciO/YrdC/YwlC family protein [Thiothrix unzii]QTR53764.1 Sua5/YciO/YrdC/YwlC family protein [Thiothrix unzii]
MKSNRAGAVTWLLPVRPEVSPLISTSANLNGQEPARSVTEILQQFDQQLGVVLDAPLGGQLQPTQIRDGRTGQIIRPS